MRRLILEEPVSRAAVWSRRLAIFALSVALVSILLARLISAEAAAALSVFAASLLCAILAIIFALTAFVIIWQTGRRGLGKALAGLFVAVLLLAGPAYLVFQATRLPGINDISSDLADPPQFSRSSRVLAARSNHVPPPAPPGARELQTRFYPSVQPVILDLEADEAYKIVQKAVAARGWRVLEQVSPGGRSGVGHIDAIERSLLFGFPDDITIRVRPLAGQTRIDFRSVSRFGDFDFGVNARRLTRFSQEVLTQLEAR